MYFGAFHSDISFMQTRMVGEYVTEILTPILVAKDKEYIHFFFFFFFFFFPWLHSPA
jgi:hypothetical protein